MSVPGVRMRVVRFPALAAVFAVAGGCNQSAPTPLPKLRTVAGYVKLGGAPLPNGTVTFHPDPAKGNNLSVTPYGVIAQDGSYKLTTGGDDGAPLGWYKVTVAPSGMPKEMPARGEPMPKAPAFNAKYQKPNSSGISIEVVEAPKSGAYDIELSK
jgi:hypothetical protein